MRQEGVIRIMGLDLRCSRRRVINAEMAAVSLQRAAEGGTEKAVIKAEGERAGAVFHEAKRERCRGQCGEASRRN